MNSTELINKHGRRVHVVNARVEILLSQGYSLAPPAKANHSEPPPKTESEPGLDADGLKAELEQLTKADIAMYALEHFSLELDETAKKDDLIAAVLLEAFG